MCLCQLLSYHHQLLTSYASVEALSVDEENGVELEVEIMVESVEIDFKC